MDKKQRFSHYIAQTAIWLPIGCVTAMSYVSSAAYVINVFHNDIAKCAFILAALAIVTISVMVFVLYVVCPEVFLARKRQKKLTPVSDEEYAVMASTQYGIPQDYAIAVKRYFETELDMPMPWLVPKMTLSQIDYYCPVSDFLMWHDIINCDDLKDVDVTVREDMTVGDYARVMFDLGVCFDANSERKLNRD